ncbi:hypothetical protein FWK35_00034352 [Aphis craccivora]|uniref:Uncharacterized protein n=1 Tax=Aphis craccivora TaxID=307492 RepID=A0A6G0VX89_APHCR|nr:hypothetical protein FWK35_00034352 [Aphis craccivora]
MVVTQKQITVNT